MTGNQESLMNSFKIDAEQTVGKLEKPDPSEKLSIVFVCQGGPLEAESILLCASAKKHIKYPYQIIAAVPNEADGITLPSTKTLDHLKELGAEFFFFTNELLNELENPGRQQIEGKEKNPHYLANKIYTLCAPIVGKRLLFLDTDTYFIASPWIHRGLALPLVLHSIGDQGAEYLADLWPAMYQQLGIDMPQQRFYEKSSKGRVYSPPAFCSDRIFIQQQYAQSLHELWKQTYVELYNSQITLNDSRQARLTEQASFTLAVIKSGLPYCCETGLWMVHYLNPSNIGSSQALDTTPFGELLDAFPQVHELLKGEERWQRALTQAKR